MNKTSKSQLNECALERTQIREENVNLKLTINKLNKSYKEVEDTNKELKNTNKKLKENLKVYEFLKIAHVNIKKRIDNLNLP